MAYQRGSVAGVEVAQNAEIFVVTTCERRAGVRAAGGVHNGSVQRETEFSHRIRLVGFFRGQQLGTRLAKDFLRDRKNALVLFATSRDIQQTEQNARRIYADRIVEISRAALTGKRGREFGILQTWKGRR